MRIRQQRHIEERLERIHQREQEALGFARAMDPLILANGVVKKPPGMTAQQMKENAVRAAKAVGLQTRLDLECPQWGFFNFFFFKSESDALG